MSILKDLLEKIWETIDKHKLRSNLYKSLAHFILQLALLIICNRCDLMTRDIQEKFMEIFRHEKIIEYTKNDADENNKSLVDRSDLDDSKSSKIFTSNSIFANVISGRFLHLMEDKPRENFQVFADFLMTLVKNQYLDVDSLTTQSLTLYKEEWKRVSTS